MRRNQLSLTLESFADQAVNGESHIIKAYIDGNDIHKVLRDFAALIHSIYAEEGKSFEDFVKESLKCEEDFGRFDAKMRDSDGNVRTYGFGEYLRLPEQS